MYRPTCWAPISQSYGSAHQVDTHCTPQTGDVIVLPTTKVRRCNSPTIESTYRTSTLGYHVTPGNDLPVEWPRFSPINDATFVAYANKRPHIHRTTAPKSSCDTYLMKIRTARPSQVKITSINTNHNENVGMATIVLSALHRTIMCQAIMSRKENVDYQFRCRRQRPRAGHRISKCR